MNTLEKIRYLLADRFKYFQYPNIKIATKKPTWEPKGSSIMVDFDSKTGNERLSFVGKMLVFCFSIFTLAAGLILAGFGIAVIVLVLFQ